MIPYGRQNITDDDIEVVTKALRADFLTQGPTIHQFAVSYTHLDVYKRQLLGRPDFRRWRGIFRSYHLFLVCTGFVLCRKTLSHLIPNRRRFYLNDRLGGEFHSLQLLLV